MLTPAVPTSRRRGRPFRLPEDTSPISTVHGGVDKRVAWLLATWRLHASDPELAHRDHFVPALNKLGIAADQARVSRWESGSQRVPDRVVAAYEHILGLLPGKITAAAYGLRRSLEPDSPALETVTLTPNEIQRELDPLFEKAYDEPDGGSWLELTNYLATHRNIYLRPDTWHDVSDRIISEMVRSTGPAFTRRYEALRSLVCHSGAQPYVVHSIGAFVTDPDAQSVIYPLTLLQEVDHPRAQALSRRLLATSSGPLQQGAAWVTAAKLTRGHFDEQELRQLEGTALLMLAAGPKATADVDILDVAVHLPNDAQRRIERAVRETELHQTLEQLLDHGEILPREVTRVVSVELATRAQELLPAPYHIDADTMLQRLLREGLFHGHQERRHQAGVLLCVSAYRPAVAQALVELVERRDDLVAERAVMLLRHVAMEGQHDALAALATSATRPQVAAYAMLGLARIEQGLTDADEVALMDVLTQHNVRNACANPADNGACATERAAIHALGMNGSPQLARLEQSGTDFQRRAAGWWRRTGPAIHESSWMSARS